MNKYIPTILAFNSLVVCSILLLGGLTFANYILTLPDNLIPQQLSNAKWIILIPTLPAYAYASYEVHGDIMRFLKNGHSKIRN